MISIIIPTFNEKENIQRLLNKLLSLENDKEMIIIDDNSPDGTAQMVKKNFINNKKIKVFVRKKEKGLGTAILYGINKSKGEVIVGMDADFNHPPELIPQLLKNIKNYDLVIASRFIKGGGMEDKCRYIFTYLFNLFLKKLLGFPIMDNMSGFYAIRKDKLNLLPLKEIYYGYGDYHLRLVWQARKKGLSIKEVPVYYPKRIYGKSKSNLFILFFRYLIVAFSLKFNKRK